MLHENQLTGTIPDTFGSLGALRSLRLAENQLEGTIPGDLEYLPALDKLSVGGNAGLTGCVPAQLRDTRENDLDGLGLRTAHRRRLCRHTSARTAWSCRDPEDNAGLVSDCAVLLASEAALTGGGTLGWDPGVPITAWEGVVVGGNLGACEACT